ncbi:MAG: CYTH domain-containing protein [Patescibacteria group bacterium]|jgi:predicted adenylyl cyclase CyaB
MIEIEKKFALSDKDQERLIQGAQFLKEKIFTDVYYDTTDLALTTNDKWLRSRDGKFELKLSLRRGTDRLADQYDELEDEESIKHALGLDVDGDLADLLAANGYSPFVTITTVRTKYHKDGFGIDLDAIDFGDYTHHICEIELMVEDQSEIDNAIERIINFAKEQGLTVGPVRGKVVEYLKKANPTHYWALVNADVVKDF